MTKTRIALFIFAVISVGCGGIGGGGSKLEVNIAGKSTPLDISSSGSLASTKTFSMTKDGQTTSTKANSHYFAMANYELDTTAGMISMGKPLTADGHVRVTIQIIGDEGTDDKAPLKTGTYSTKAEKYNKLDYVNVAVYSEGKETKTSFNIDKAEGEVKINSVSDESVTGEINVTEGDKSVKGSFTAKITKRK